MYDGHEPWKATQQSSSVLCLASSSAVTIRGLGDDECCSATRREDLACGGDGQGLRAKLKRMPPVASIIRKVKTVRRVAAILCFYFLFYFESWVRMRD